MMMFLPFSKMWERINIEKQDSDTAFFYVLLYAGEMLLKTVAAGLVSAVSEDRERHRYRHLHHLVRADSPGGWTPIIDEILLGPTSTLLPPPAREEQRELTQKVGDGTWQFEAIKNLHSVLLSIDRKTEKLPTKVDGRSWFPYFAELRNATRAHGAPGSGLCSQLCTDLEKSIQLFVNNLKLFQRPWAYLHRNLSGKYKIIALSSADTSPLNYLKSTTSANLSDGVYIFFDEPARVELIETNIDVTDFFYPNGNFSGKKYEVISYISGNKKDVDSSPYLAPSGELPSSETQGIGTLELHGKSWANLPPASANYVIRRELEEELFRALGNDRHPIITIRGGGGVGKTSIALKVIHELAEEERFNAIIWFSARDIDLLPEGPKSVKPKVLTNKDIAEEFSRLLGPSEARRKDFDPLLYMGQCMTESPLDGPILFVFDNFETVRNPLDIFGWLDVNIRNPNKILITTRKGDFKADYWIEVSGMTEAETDELINTTARRLGIEELITQEYRHDLFQEAGGHPYIVKILVGEVAKAHRLVNVERIVAGKDEMLNALFERTFSTLSPGARRVFLTLCSWRSVVAQIALEAVLLRPENERIDIENAIDELAKSSFIEQTQSAEDNMIFITVPLAASIFGRPKIDVNPMKPEIESDTALLQVFGAAQLHDIKHGIRPRIDRLFRFVAIQVSKNCTDLERYLPLLEFIARKYPPAWLSIAKLHEESNISGSAEDAKEAIGHFIESKPNEDDQAYAWEWLSRICSRTGDLSGEVIALLEMCKLPHASLLLISNTINRLNGYLHRRELTLNVGEKQTVIMQFIELMEKRITEADANDYSRLAWLCRYLHDKTRAIEYTKKGLIIDPFNEHCLKLARNLGITK